MTLKKSKSNDMLGLNKKYTDIKNKNEKLESELKTLTKKLNKQVSKKSIQCSIEKEEYNKELDEKIIRLKNTKKPWLDGLPSIHINKDQEQNLVQYLNSHAQNSGRSKESKDCEN